MEFKTKYQIETNNARLYFSLSKNFVFDKLNRLRADLPQGTLSCRSGNSPCIRDPQRDKDP